MAENTLSLTEAAVLRTTLQLSPSAYGGSINSKLNASGLNIPRANVYAAITSLNRKGFVEKSKRSRRTYVSVLQPGSDALDKAITLMKIIAQLAIDLTFYASKLAKAF